MKSFFWKITICVVPVLLACLAIWDAYVNDKFKLGVDLSGGTILVYEMDFRKAKVSEDKKGEEKAAARERDFASEAREKAGELAEALKRRIDPTATYNIVIRPAGTEGRVELIIPTGGQERAEEIEKAWQKMLAEVAKHYDIKLSSVPRGNIEEVVDLVQEEKSWETWQSKLFSDKKAWDGLLASAEERWVQLTQPAKAAKAKEAKQDEKKEDGKADKAKGPTKMDRLREVPVGHLKELAAALEAQLPDQTAAGIEGWLRQRAWEEMIDKVIAWEPLREHLEKELTKKAKGKDEAPDVDAELKALDKELKTIPPDSFSELIGRIEAKGNVVTQATLDTLQPLLGNPAQAVPGLLPRDKVRDLVTEYYGPAGDDIRKVVEENYDLPGHARDLSVEEVQKIKDLVSKVGALEFRILANSADDAPAIAEAQDLINNPEKYGIVDEMERRAINGQPPPTPNEVYKTDPYDISLAAGAKAKVTYSWVELGKQERAALGLNNEAKNAAESRKKDIWFQVNSQANKALKIEDPASTGTKKDYIWQGALFYRRETKDRNLPEKERRDKKFDYFVLARDPEVVDGVKQAITGELLRSAATDTTSGRPVVSFVFNAEGGSLFGDLTGKNVPTRTGGSGDSEIKRHLAIILDGLVMSAPTINSKISTHGQITGDFTKKDVDGLVNILRSGALPATLKPQPVSESTIGATLGRDTITAGVSAVFWSFIAVLVFMCVYYRFSGVVACIALFANLVLTVGFMVAVQATFTLAGLAGLVLMLGMAVDANVLIYERFREERDRGASLALALRNAYERAFPTIIDTHLTSIFTAVVLYAMGNDALKGFAISLAVGLIISLFTSLYMTHVIFDLAMARGWLKTLGMMRILTRPNINFMGIRYAVFAVTMCVTLFGLGLFLARMPKDLNIDFKGGTAFSAQLRLDKEGDKVISNQARSIGELRDLVAAGRQRELLDVTDVQEVDGSDGREYKVVYADPDGGQESYNVVVSESLPGDTPEERAAALKERTSELPDASVEILFPGYASTEEGKLADQSRFFTVRTSETERDLVQVMLDRLLRAKDEKSGTWTTLLNKIEMTADVSGLEDGGKKAVLAFSSPASPMYVKSLLNNELGRELTRDEQGRLSVRYDVIGEGESEEGRFPRMVIRFDELPEADVAKVKQAVERVETVFNQRPQPERLENFDSEMAADTRLQALGAVFVSWLAVVLYLWFRFGSWQFGLAAVLCLVHDLCFTLGLLAISAYLQGIYFFDTLLQIEDFKLDLTGVAALLTLVGYSVADTIVVFDRIREVRGKNPDLTPKIVNDSINQTLSRTLLTSGTTFLVVIVLYFFGGPGVHLFAFIMSAGVLIGTYSSIYVASPLLLMLGEGKHHDTRGRQRPAQAAAANA